MTREREGLVSLLRDKGIFDELVLGALAEVPRELFVSEDLKDRAYENSALPIGEGQTISQPQMIAIMLQEMRLAPGQSVLEVGAGSGYQTALLSQMCLKVAAVERIPELAEAASERLSRLGFERVRLVVGDGSVGYSDAAPYDRIIVSCAAPEPPEALKQQLEVGGLLAVPIGSRSAQALAVVKRTSEDEFEVHDRGGCFFVPLIGEQGWPEDQDAP